MANSPDTTIARIKRHLASIGKRASDGNGNNIFSNITSSSTEASNILTEYVTTAKNTLISTLSPYVVGLSGSTFTFATAYNGVTFASDDMVNDFIVYFAVGDFLSMTHPEYSKKYMDEANMVASNIKKVILNQVVSTPADALAQRIQRHLLSIGERVVDAQGNDVFSSITSSSQYSRDIFAEYITTAKNALVATLSPYVVSVNADYSLSFNNVYGLTSFAQTDMVKDFIVYFSVGDFLAMSHPEYAKKYHDEAGSIAADILRIILKKTSGQSNNDYSFDNDFNNQES